MLLPCPRPDICANQCRILVQCLWAVVCCASIGVISRPEQIWAAEPEADPAVTSNPAALEFFEKKIRPLLVSRCHECHGPKQNKGGLRLDARDLVLAGGESGPALVPGKPDESLLVDAVRYGQIFQMPPKGKLPDEEVAALVEWVRLGAPWPNAQPLTAERIPGGPLFTEEERSFWAFQPPVERPLPTVKNAAWPTAPLDFFVLARLEQDGLMPVAAADKQTLLRRATFDLSGLPPTADELVDFLADESPEAFSRVVDRLLASPQYGERWARHWLDVARYADSNGLDENVAYGNAWRYRDYVVGAFNSDKPFDQFLLEQIAGDLAPPVADRATTHERLIATGFLALGPKVLAEVDETKMEMDIIDEQLDTFGRAILGLTLGCARCHDHKFDPIPTEDYYSLAGVFKSTRTMEHFKKIARWHENPIPSEADLVVQAEHERQVARQSEAIQQVIAAADERLKSADESPPATDQEREARYPDETKAELKRLRDALAELAKLAPALPTAMGVSEGTATDVPVHIRGNPLTTGAVAPRRFPRVLAGEEQTPLDAGRSGRLELAQWLVGADHPLTSRVMANRIWRWHFGQGLVRSTDNFGRLGEPPSHPELLDWLALRFVESGWSVKAMHRLMMLSASYQLSSNHDERAAVADPENRLRWRMDVRRLEAEEIRDSMLAVSGLLERSMGGSLLQVKNRDYLFDHTSKDTTRYDSRRRSLYLPVIRNHLYDVFQLFDATDASVPEGNRVTTTIAPQALFMMNGELMAEATAALADDALSQPAPDDAARIGWIYVRAYGRQSTAAELGRAQAALARFERLLADKVGEPTERHRQSWALLCQVILAANEFIYLR